MKQKFLSGTLALAMVAAVAAPAAFADNNDPPRTGRISGRTVLASATSLIIWPGIGQAINSDKGDKIATHAVLGLLPPYRFWSAYDALLDREGGYWHGRI